MAQQAVAYAERGKAIFPTWPGRKTPHSHLAPHGVKDASADPVRVRAWWDLEPLAGIGFPTGRVNGLTVLDLDVKAGRDGVATYLLLCDAYEVEASDGLVTHTPNGGMHVWYATGDEPVPNTPGWAEGVDIRGDGGYVVVPPSFVRLPVGRGPGDPKRGDSSYLARYRFGDNWQVPVIPQVLLDGLRRDRWSTASTGPQTGASDELPPTDWLREHGLRPGTRNNDVHRLAARLFRQLPGRDELVVAVCREAWEATYDTSDFPWDEAERAIASARRFVTGQRDVEQGWVASWTI